ncbi:hypothetical protein BGLA2_2240003 [Burkholderia gladioli]|nr:hypothetical protein BGLA2_2240003 [Burkholderia gladioli]
MRRGAADRRAVRGAHAGRAGLARGRRRRRFGRRARQLRLGAADPRRHRELDAGAAVLPAAELRPGLVLRRPAAAGAGHAADLRAAVAGLRQAGRAARLQRRGPGRAASGGDPAHPAGGRLPPAGLVLRRRPGARAGHPPATLGPPGSAAGDARQRAAGPRRHRASPRRGQHPRRGGERLRAGHARGRPHHAGRAHARPGRRAGLPGDRQAARGGGAPARHHGARDAPSRGDPGRLPARALHRRAAIVQCRAWRRTGLGRALARGLREQPHRGARDRRRPPRHAAGRPAGRDRRGPRPPTEPLRPGDAMESLFERDDARYQVLVNAAGQHSLWPESLDLPAGWQVALPAGPRREALDYVERHWAGLGADQTA